MQSATSATELDEIVHWATSLGLSDGVMVWTYGGRADVMVRPGLSASTGGALCKARTLFDETVKAVQPYYLRHLSSESLEWARVSGWSSIRDRAGDLGPLFDDEVHRPCGIVDYIRSYLVVDDEVIGFVGACRSVGPGFSKSEIRVFELGLPAVTRMMARVVKRERDLHHQALLIGEDGRLLHGTGGVLMLVDRLGDREQVAGILAHHARHGARTADLGEVTFALERLSGPMGRAVLARPKAGKPVRVSPIDLLTYRQQQVAYRVAAGGDLHEIADSLNVTPQTVRSHLKAIYLTLAIGSRAELVQLVEDHGGLRPEPLAEARHDGDP